MSGAPLGGGPVDASRGLYCVQCGVVISHAVWRLALLRMLRRVAAADLLGLRPFRRGSLKYAQACRTLRRPEAKRLKRWAQGSCTHVSAVIGGQGLSYGRCTGVRVSVPRASQNASGHGRIMLQNIGGERNSRFSSRKQANLQQAAGTRFHANYGFQKKQLNPSEIDDFDVFEVSKKSKYLISYRFCSVFATS